MSRKHFPMRIVSPEDLPPPPHAQLAFQGKVFQVWQWEQKMSDGSVEIFERLKRPNTAQVIPVVGDKILIQTEEQPDKSKPFLSLPGGRCGLHENPLDAAKRELLEEAGYASNDWILCKEQNSIGRTENPSFYERELVAMLLYARFDPKIREEFYNLLFTPLRN